MPMTQEQFNDLMDVYLAQYLSGGYYTLKYTGEQLDAMLDSLNSRVKALEGQARATAPAASG